MLPFYDSLTVPGKSKGQAFSAWKLEPEGHYTR